MKGAFIDEGALPLFCSEERGSARPIIPLSFARYVWKYFIPVSHMTVTTVASGCNRSANRKAASTLPPVEVPAKRPSSRASRKTMAVASSVETCSI
jgi:hypothetical protein